MHVPYDKDFALVCENHALIDLKTGVLLRLRSRVTLVQQPRTTSDDNRLYTLPITSTFS